jgi:hypothetical protein
MQIKCDNCSGVGHYKVADWEESCHVWGECNECEGTGKIEIEIEEEEENE